MSGTCAVVVDQGVGRTHVSMTDRRLIDRRRLAHAGPARRRQRAQAAGRRPVERAAPDRQSVVQHAQARTDRSHRRGSVPPTTLLLDPDRAHGPARGKPADKPADKAGHGRLG
jgi:hypothetical protein